MPDLRIRHEHYRAIDRWCREHGYERVSVWGFKHGAAPRYSSVTRDGYIGMGPGAGSHLPDGFVLNTFDLPSYIRAACSGLRTTALRMPFMNEMSGWWWLYWRFYDTRIPLSNLDEYLGLDAPKARRLLGIIQKAGLAFQNGGQIVLTEAGAFWLHLVQNYFALNYVNTLWTQSRREPWPQEVVI